MHDRQERHGGPGEPATPHERETLLDEVAERLGFRDTIRRHRALDVLYRSLVGFLGIAIMVTGVALIPLP
ncbi:MAG: hypothetical protein ACRDV1_13715, partial [Actinomycetes bacterium]